VTGTARWAELKLEEFEERIAAKPVAYLPMGLCEPHGHAAAIGLDLLKADYICDQAAARFGGIVAPSQGYHIHETGYHAPFLRETVGAANPRLAALPPDVILRTLLFQFRAFVNAGFRTVVVVSGHNGAQADLRLVAAEFMKLVPVPVIVHSDPELVAGRYPGDHAGKFELSQLMYCRPELVDLSRVPRSAHHRVGRFAQGPDAGEASAEYGKLIIEAMIDRVGELVATADPPVAEVPFLSFADVEPAWDAVSAVQGDWVSLGVVSG
jgi:creatinine amidohydrolase